jgi:hypothetical protein
VRGLRQLDGGVEPALQDSHLGHSELHSAVEGLVGGELRADSS